MATERDPLKDPTEVADDFVWNVLMPYLDAQKRPVDVTIRETVALLAGFRGATGLSVSVVHLDNAVWRAMRTAASDPDNAIPQRRLASARILSQQLLQSPISVIWPALPHEQR